MFNSFTEMDTEFEQESEREEEEVEMEQESWRQDQSALSRAGEESFEAGDRRSPYGTRGDLIRIMKF